MRRNVRTDVVAREPRFAALEKITFPFEQAILRQTNDFKATIINQQNEIEALTVGLEKLSARIGENMLTPKVIARAEAPRTRKNSPNTRIN